MSSDRCTKTIVDELLIHRTLAEYCQMCDHGAFDALGDLFTAEGAFVSGGDIAVGRVAVVSWFATHLPPALRGKHLTANAIVDVLDDRAEVRSDFLFLSTAATRPQIVLAGRYRDAFRRVDGRWLIERRECIPMRPAFEHSG